MATSSSSEAEIRQCFDVLDEDRTGTISLHGLTTLLRSLGHRVNRNDVVMELEGARQRRRRRRGTSSRVGHHEGAIVVTDDDATDDDNANTSTGQNQMTRDGDIDVELVLEMLSQERYRDASSSSSHPSSSSSSRSRTAELQQIFRLFDVDGKGVITLDNLRSVAREVYGNEASKGSGRSSSSNNSRSSALSGIIGIDDDLLRSMIEAFDRDLDEGINLEEFSRIMGG